MSGAGGCGSGSTKVLSEVWSGGGGVTCEVLASKLRRRSSQEVSQGEGRFESRKVTCINRLQIEGRKITWTNGSTHNASHM